MVRRVALPATRSRCTKPRWARPSRVWTKWFKDFIACAEQETWVRCFPSHRMSSRLSLRQGQLTEQLGAARLTFELSEHAGSLNMQIRSLHVLGLRCPARLLPQVSARESAAAAASDLPARLHFQVQASLPWVGRVAHYQGFLELPNERPQTCRSASGPPRGSRKLGSGPAFPCERPK